MPPKLRSEDEHHSPTMANRAKTICDELKVCREEAIFYLEGFDWELDAAMEACRSRTLDLPSITVESPPKEKSTSTQSRYELIIEFCNVAVGADVRDAASYLERNNWDLQRAISEFIDDRRPTPSKPVTSKLMREDKIPKARPLMVSSQLKIQESTSPVRTGEEKLSPVKESSMSSSQLPEKLSQSEEDSIKSFRAFATKASRKAAIACLQLCKWNEEDALGFFFGDYCREATPGIASSLVDESLKAKAVDEDSSTESLEEAGREYIPEARGLMESSQVKIQTIQESSSPTQTREETLSPVKEFAEVAPPIVIDSRTSSNQLPNSAEQPPQWNDEHIDLFVEVTGGVLTRDHADAYLTLCNGDLDQAVNCLMEEGQTGSSFSSSNADPTETGNVSVPIPGIASSLVDGNFKDKAVDEDLGTELSPVHNTSTTIELEIRLADGGSGTQVWILARSDETVGDIRNRVEAFRSESNRDYYFMSDTGVVYRDSNTTVQRITSGSRGGSTTLHQLYST